MRTLFAFLKTTFIGGLVFLAPLFLAAVLLVRVERVLRRLAQPLIELLSVDTAIGLLVADIVGMVLILALCFVAGLVAKAEFARRFVSKAEAGVLWRIPGYGFVKGLTDSLDKSAATASMRPVMVHFDDYAQLAFEVDRLPDGRKVVYVPSAPDPRAGAVLVFDQDRVEPVAMSFMAAITSLRTLGRGLGPSIRPPGGVSH